MPLVKPKSVLSTFLDNRITGSHLLLVGLWAVEAPAIHHLSLLSILGLQTQMSRHKETIYQQSMEGMKPE
jgi:hypothetical protein